MDNNTPTAATPVEEFGILHYMMQSHWAGKPQPGRHVLILIKRVVKILTLILRRTPRLSDLDEENLNHLVRHPKVRPLSPQRVKMLRETYLALWRQAADMGIVTLPDKFRRKVRIVHRDPQNQSAPFPLEDGAGTIWGLCVNQFFPRRMEIRSASTRVDYKRATKALGAFLGRQPMEADLNDDTITLWLKSLLDNCKSIYTVREMVGRILTLWNWAARRRIVEQFPTVKRPRAPDPVPIALDEAELSRLFASASLERGKIAGIPANLWWPAWLAFVYNTGERFGAASVLRWEWVDLSRGVASIPASVRKGRQKNAVYHLYPETVALLAGISMPKRELVFPWPKSQETYYLDYGKILKRAGLPQSRKYKTHCLRATHATMKTVLGGDASRALMHSDSATTKRHYIDVRHLPPDTIKLPTPWAVQSQAKHSTALLDLDAMAFI